jgi:hypothetical protein
MQLFSHSKFSYTTSYTTYTTSFLQQLTKYFIMCPLYSRHVSALILGHLQDN